MSFLPISAAPRETSGVRDTILMSLQVVSPICVTHVYRNGLTPGQTYIVQVSADGAAGETSWSAITSMMAV